MSEEEKVTIGVTVGEFRRAPKRTWKSSEDHSGMTCYLGMEGRVTVRQLLDHFAENYPHVDVMGVELNWVTAVWDEPPTPEDILKREHMWAQQRERTERWERETLARLKAKYDEGDGNA